MPGCPVCGTDNPERARFCLECGRRLAEARPDASESRRTVTVLFSDIVGSTALGESLDPETLRGVMSRYFAAMEEVLDRHGGTVEKFIGDAIMAVFGLRLIHEDDALRAVRAALEMRESLALLNVDLLAERGVSIATRTGVQTGEVVAGDPSARQTLVTGDAVNTAARLEQAASANEILVGESTWRLIRDAVVVERVPAIPAKGKAEPVPAVRLVSLRSPADAPTAARSSLLVGRSGELARLSGVFDRVLIERQPELITVLGPAGVGKSRLVAEFIAEAADRATVLRGRCLPYGEGISYWPLRDILHSAAGIRDDDPPAEGQRKLASLVESVPDGSLVAARLASAIGLSAEGARREEIFWAVRKTIEHLAATHPLVLVVEDIHSAEALFLELLDQLIDLSREIPLLIVTPARTELLDRHPDWGRDRPRVTTIVLDGLDGDAAADLLDSLPGGATIPPELRARILASAEGNPLFVTEMVSMLVEDGLLGTTQQPARPGVDPNAVKVPPTIQALMAARVDGLPNIERSVAQRASVVGRVFEEDALLELTPPPTRPEVTAALLALMRRELVAPEPSNLSLVDAYKFRHILIRDAAYEALRKTDRADLHERFADWLERAAGDRLMELEEIVGYHLGEAHRYRLELRETGPHTDEIGQRAADHLRAAAKLARDRGDSAAAVGMYAHADALPSRGSSDRAALLLDAGLALYDLGRAAEAGQRAEGALELAGAVGDNQAAARARLLRIDARLADGTLVNSDPAMAAELDAALAAAEASGDAVALAEAWHARGAQSWSESRLDDSSAEDHKAREFARLAGDRRLELDIEGNLLVHAFASPTPASEVVILAKELADRAVAHPTVRAEAQMVLAVSEAMLGQFEEAQRHVEQSIATLRDLAQIGALANARTFQAWVHRLAGDLPAAEAILCEALADAVGIEDRGLESFVSCRLAEVLVGQERFDEAEPYLAVAERAPIGATRSRIVGAHARIRAARGDRTATADVEELMGIVADGPWLNVRTEAYLDAAHAMTYLGSRVAAEAYARAALEMCLAKQDVALAARTEAFLAQIGTNGYRP